MASRADWESMRRKGESKTGSVFSVSVEVVDPKTREKRHEKRYAAQFRAFDHSGTLRTYRSTKHATRALAWRAMPELQARAIAGKLPPKQAERERETVAAYLEAWHARRVRTKAIRPKTAENEARHVRLIATTELGSLPLRDVTHGDVERFLRELEDVLEGKPRARQQVYQVVRTAFRAAPRDTWKVSPLEGVRPPKAPKPETKSFTAAELAAILERVDAPLSDDSLVDEPFAALVHFMARTGVRSGEAQALRWAAVDLAAGTARIEASAFEQNGRGVQVGPTKSAKPRTVHLPASLVERLQALRSRLQPTPLDVSARFVFGPDGGAQPFRRSNLLRRRWHVLQGALGLERCGFHRLRHTWASLSLAAGADVMTVSSTLGHASAGFTLSVYGHAMPDRQAEAAERFDALLAAAPR